MSVFTYKFDVDVGDYVFHEQTNIRGLVVGLLVSDRRELFADVIYNAPAETAGSKFGRAYLATLELKRLPRRGAEQDEGIK